MSTIYTLAGTIAQPTNPLDGVDPQGFFGQPYGILIDQPFTATFTVMDCNPCVGGRDPYAIYSNPVNPILDATLTINGHTYDFNGPVSVGSITINNIDNSLQFDMAVWIPHTSIAPNGFVSTWYSRADLQNAGFFIDNGIVPCCTQAEFFPPPAVPGPTVGENIFALIAFPLLITYWWWNKKMSKR